MAREGFTALLAELAELMVSGVRLEDSRMPPGLLKDFGKAAKGDVQAQYQCERAYRMFGPLLKEEDPLMRCWARHYSGVTT
jgi:hypothetical protein